MNEDLPFKVGYVSTFRITCEKCKRNIAKDSVRIAIIVESFMYDEKMPLWHHLNCFFEKNTALKSTLDIANFQNLRWDDQEKIKQKMSHAIEEQAGSSVHSGKSDFSVEYAKSDRIICRGCAQKIVKGMVRISKFGMEDPKAACPKLLWHHIDCFVKRKEELGYLDSADKLPGYDKLTDEDKQELMSKIGSKGVKRKSETEESESPKLKKSIRNEENTLKQQNQMLFDMRDELQKYLKKQDMVNLLKHNNQYVPSEKDGIMDHLADCMVFGALTECPDCKKGRPRFLNVVYACPAYLTEWTKCQYETKYPEREKFDVPSNFKETHPFLKNYKSNVLERCFPEASNPTKKKNFPLSGFNVCIVGKFKVPKDIIRKKIEELGGTIPVSVSSAVSLCISTSGEVGSKSSKMEKVCSNNIHVVAYDFLEDVRKGSSVPQSIKKHCICTWGDDPISKFGIKKENGDKNCKGDKNEDEISKTVPQKMKITVKDGAAVDPESGLDAKCHVYQKEDSIYNVVLAHVDTFKGINSFCKLQILKENNQPKYHLFQQWGRVGTTIGFKKVEQMFHLDAISVFQRLYLKKTGNHWWNRKKFKKKPGCFYPLEIDYGEDFLELQQLKSGSNSKLPEPVQELICFIFDIEAMKKAMIEFEIDLKKMPLGKLSKKQIQNAQKVLHEALEILETRNNTSKIMDASNRFYTLIPHDFGMRKPPMLDNEELIKSKIEMVDSLLEIEFAYNLIKGVEHDACKNPVDEHYEKLKTDISVVEKGSHEYATIHKYLKNTHSPNHSMYQLELNQIYKIKREGEDERFKKYENLHNKKLLWHGSRLTNFVGILSQGLRIAPPEAMHTGEMFGKGIYFADMVSKSANYCRTTRENTTGLLLLCEVALGDMYEGTYFGYITEKPQLKHSILGLGMTVPDPKEKTFLDSVEVPFGKPTRSNIQQGLLLHNEYVVYNTDQIKLRYLLKVNFRYKY